ncbi:conserved protein of unknown function [Georgfuchsia toluolica]|uniref:Amidohydrolase 3 domain-containing protein n=2 Tax=Georgfuchsia toluolica TaxID=424218 RepID=A0A916J7P9_9PROT|nr:conserved protein of unknown function [Georgfuchsia toluolica]CAG4885457.1 conserved protein of unknown function [Georgfuchsia toluolica]
MAVDLILCNLKAITFSQECAGPELIAIKGNKILFMGSKDALGDLKGPDTRMLDCQGGIVLPGFNDAHCHPIAFAITQRYLDCSSPQIRCISDLQAALRIKAGEVADERWIRGANYDISIIAEQRLPDRWELDQAVPHLPVVLVERSGQHCVLNSRALEHCDISNNTPDSDAGRILRDPITGLPNGVVSGNSELVARAIPPLGDDEVEIGLRDASQEYLSHGITSLQDTSWSNAYPHWQRMQIFKQRGFLTPRLAMHAGLDALEQFALRGLKTGHGDDHLRLGAMKIALDESTGSSHPPQDDLNQSALRAHLAGFQLAFHVPDVHLLQMSLQALEFVRCIAPDECHRPRFEHCPVCPTSLLPELAQSGAIVVSQPNLLYQTGPEYLRELAAEQLKWIFPYRSCIENGIRLAFSSDSPLTPCDPLQAIRTAITRRVKGGARLGEDEAISLLQALEMYTSAGAYCSSEETLKGSLAVGQLADLVILECGADKGLADELLDARVLMTLLDGKLVWNR